MRDARAYLRDGPTWRRRIAVLCFAAICAAAAAVTMAQAGLAAGFGPLDGARVALILLTTGWLAWGAGQAFLGLGPLPTLPNPAAGRVPPTAILIPICNENPTEVRARIVAMRASVAAAGVPADFVILSDSSGEDTLRKEQAAFALLDDPDFASHRVYYRNRTERVGRKAGNVEDFIRSSGGAYEYVVLLDADSLMEGETIRHLIARMEADPGLGLLQTLPKIVGAGSLFGRAMQFAASFHSPVFARGLARLQGRAGPYWGHNAIARVRALAHCCGLPELRGKPPFGGTILSHDYVEAALLARGGWRVEMDPRIPGSYEEGPDNLLAYARRDRRWCQGNLQHIRLVNAPGLLGWSRFVFVQGILSYLVSIAWGAFLIVSLLATATAPLPDYFPETYQLFPVFPTDRTFQIVVLAIGIGGLLLLPKLSILLEAAVTGRARPYGGTFRAFASVLAETLLTALIAPVMLIYQTRAVTEVFAGRDGGWPSTARGEGQLSLAAGWRAGRWIMLVGLGAAGAVLWIAPELSWWMSPVTVPMIAAPLLIAVTSWPVTRAVFRTPEETAPAPVVLAYRETLARPPVQKDLPSDPAARSA
ncbi:glucans biosynthesis glucosyltransferase MdoH [Palleronia abyssalis]|uniref:Glucans biosynthesis glucosyltransferase H n=1 Tax=Palleronia abyssalis TaxID=1501240 RepID=A0A2R8BXM3_9RHOB|nr:glucans biosynthesis glucosyltransferase MdoH [Palleronia abyssalis]SPJ24911.1 Glucans biosynthesis glucosyltransferase H [Palleronia abyssalis]